MILQVKVNVEPALQYNRALMRQIPIIQHWSVDATSKQAQAAIQQSLATHFTLRRKTKGVEQTIKHLQFSKKGTPTAIIGVDPQQDYLAKFEQGGSKTPRAGTNLAVPIEARASKAAIVPKALRPAVLGAKAFKLKSKKGNVLLVQRIGKATATRRRKKGIVTPRGHDPRLKVLYVLKPSVPIPASLHFVEIANRVARERWPINARAAMERALRTARS